MPPNYVKNNSQMEIEDVGGDQHQRSTGLHTPLLQIVPAPGVVGSMVLIHKFHLSVITFGFLVWWQFASFKTCFVGEKFPVVFHIILARVNVEVR